MTFKDKIDHNLLSSIALSEGYTIDYGSYKLRILDKGVIVARVGSKSDKGSERSVFLYLIPSSIEVMNLYDKCAASIHGILDEECGRIDLGKLVGYNLKILRMIDRYWAYRYGSRKP
ncbi:MAG: hypothetical protein QW374_06540 [Candidatus Bathyarchaeia archaeon]|nr:hypothetical protein [Candidatus Bathyarchaeota archaeon]